jgi:hypothetical protein
MRSLALTALLGSFAAFTNLAGQSLTEHAAAAAGATIGTAAGKPLGTALGQVFGQVNKTTSTAAGTKTAKPSPAKPVAVAPAATTEHAAAAHPASGGGSDAAGENGASSHHTARSKEPPAQSAPTAAGPATPVIAEPVIAIQVVKEPSAQDVAGIKVGATATELSTVLGPPESTVSIPGDDGHLLEIRQYWAKGEQVGTVHLDNGRVVSVQSSN